MVCREPVSAADEVVGAIYRTPCCSSMFHLACAADMFRAEVRAVAECTIREGRLISGGGATLTELTRMGSSKNSASQHERLSRTTAGVGHMPA